MDNQTPEPLHALLPIETRRSIYASCHFRSLPVGSVVLSTLGLSGLALTSNALTSLVLTSFALTSLALTAFVLTGCSASPGHSALAEASDKQSRPIPSRAEEGSGVSSGGSIGGDSGSAAAVSGDPDASVSSDDPGQSAPDTAVSSGPLDDQHQWTQEEMLLARPMPETQEERDFVFKHKAAESIRTWTLGEFQDYTNSPMGRSQMLQEGRRWVSIKTTLKEQLALGQDFLAGGGKSKPKKAKSVEDSQAPEPIPEFLIDDGVFVGTESATTFDRLKECRQDITDLCRAIEAIKKTASKRGRLDALERYLNSQ